MISRIIKKTVDLSKIQKVDQLEGPLYQLENGGHTFEITCLMDGEAAAVSGTVSARFLRADEETVYFTGTLTGNVASVTLPQSCYNVNGRFGLVIFVSGNDITSAVYAVAGSVYRSTSDHIIDPSEEIPSLEDLIAKIDECEEATADAQQAASFVPSIIASTYSTSVVYAVGDYCTYEGAMYRCTAETDGAFDPADWEAVKVGTEFQNVDGQIDDLKSAFREVYENVSVDVSNANYNLIIPVVSGNTYKITNNATANASAYTTDSGNTQIQNIGTVGKDGGTITFTANADAYKIRGYCSGTGTIIVENVGTIISEINETLNSIEPRLDVVETKADANSNTLIINTSDLNSGYIGTDGVINAPTSSNEKYTNRIGCISGQKFQVTVTLPSSNGMWLTYAEYDSKGKFVRREGSTHGWVATYTETFSVPDGIVAIIISFRSFTGGTISISCDSWAYFMTNVNLPPLTLQRDFRLQNSAYAVSVRGINHTGYYTAPENTIPAFQLSKAHGFAFVETDLQLTSDNVPVLIHDTTINRTGRNTDGTEITTTTYVHDLTYAQIKQYDFGVWKGAQYAGTKIPTLEEFIVLCKNLNIHPYIELKGGFWVTATFAVAYEIVKKYQMESRVTWISSSDGYLRLVKAKDEYARIGYIVTDIDSTKITTCTNLLTEHNSVFIDVIYTSITDGKIELAMNAGLPVETYTVDTESALETINGYVSGVTSNVYDYPAWLVSRLSGN